MRASAAPNSHAAAGRAQAALWPTVGVPCRAKEYARELAVGDGRVLNTSCEMFVAWPDAQRGPVQRQTGLAGRCTDLP